MPCLPTGDAEAIAASPGMTPAVQAARYALARRPDYSGGGYVWDGADLQTNYTSHAKVRLGIYFTAPEHDIYRVGSKALPEAQGEYWDIPTHKNGQLRRGKERGRYTYTYESTAAYGGTVFWRLTAALLQATGNKVYE